MWLSAVKIAYTSVAVGRPRIFRHVAERVIPAHNRLAGQWGVRQHAEWASLARQHDVSTTFVLGSGSSINEYSASMFENIRSGWSVAINSWSEHHPFVPDALLIESLIDWEGLARLEPTALPSSIFVTRFAAFGHYPTNGLDSVPEGLREISKHYVALPMIGFTPSSYADYIANLLPLTDSFPHVVGPNRTSIERAVVLAALSGAREVVLCGVDLHGPHFWETKTISALKRHGTDNGNSFRRSVSRRLPVLAAVLKSRLGTTVTLGLERGPLAGVLPVHTWEIGHRHQGRPG